MALVAVTRYVDATENTLKREREKGAGQRMEDRDAEG